MRVKFERRAVSSRLALMSLAPAVLLLAGALACARNARNDIKPHESTAAPAHQPLYNVFDVALGAFCFAPETIVATEEGPMQIQELVRRPTPPRVQSFSHETGVVEYADVVGASEHSSEKDLVEVEYDGGVLRVTEDHKIWSVTRGAYVEAASLLPDEEVLVLPELPAAAS